MAIKFTDKGPEGEPKPKSGLPSKVTPEPQAEAIQPDVPGGMPDGLLPFAKTEPKTRGRKKPLK